MAAKKFNKKSEIEANITASVIAALEAGTAPWKKSWSCISGGAALRENGLPYKGFNQFILGMTGRANPYWFTYNKAAELAGCEKNEKGKWIWDDNKGVNEGETGEYICFWGKAKPKKGAEPDEKGYMFMKWYKVFNAEQISGLPAKYDITDVEEKTPAERDAAAEAYIEATGAEIRFGGDRAFFSPSQDFIQNPHIEDFVDPTAYYGTLLHELVHWTGAEKRLDRDLKNSFGTKDYAREELCAEMGATFLCGHLGLEAEPRDDHAQYIASWIKTLKEDKTALRKACAMAQKAVDYLDAFSEEEVEEDFKEAA